MPQWKTWLRPCVQASSTPRRRAAGQRSSSGTLTRTRWKWSRPPTGADHVAACCACQGGSFRSRCSISDTACVEGAACRLKWVGRACSRMTSMTMCFLILSLPVCRWGAALADGLYTPAKCPGLPARFIQRRRVLPVWRLGASAEKLHYQPNFVIITELRGPKQPNDAPTTARTRRVAPHPLSLLRTPSQNATPNFTPGACEAQDSRVGS